jgi:hypothetical protein
MRVDGLGGAISFFWIVFGFHAVMNAIWGLALAPITARMQRLQWERFSEGPFANLPPDSPFYKLMHLENTPDSILGSLVGQLVLAPVILFLIAGVVHLSGMLFGATKKGFDATVRALAYASGPLVIAVVPWCGSSIGAIWWLVVFVIGLAKLQRTSTGPALGAVAVPVVVFFCCIFVIALVAASAMVALIGGAAGLKH